MSLARITHAEANLVSLARCLVGAAPPAEVTRLLLFACAVPQKLGPTSAALLEDTLARGLALALLTCGGWTNEVAGRLWARALPPLGFTANTLRLLQWVLRTPLAEPEVARLDLTGSLTLAEEVLVVLLLQRARGTAAEAALMQQPVLRAVALAQLVHAGSLAKVAPLTVTPLTVAHLPFVQGLLDLLGDAWLDAERQKVQLAQPQVLARVGRAQALVASSFLDLLEQTQARHLARFFIDAASAWLKLGGTAKDLVMLDPEASLRERSEARHQAGALFRVVQRLEQWDQRNRGTRFIDDGYEAAQAMVKDWERLGPAGFRAAEQVVAELEALST